MGTEILTPDDFSDELAVVIHSSPIACAAMDKSVEAIRKHDASLRARLAEVEKERDEARKRYCFNASMQTYVGGSSGYTPRQVCETAWPDQADRLYPAEVTP